MKGAGDCRLSIGTGKNDIVSLLPRHQHEHPTQPGPVVNRGASTAQTYNLPGSAYSRAESFLQFVNKM
jgi:hypothetical protein